MPNLEIEQFSEEKLKQLANDRSNIVYTYKDTPEPVRVMHLDEVKDCIEQLWKEFMQLKGNRTLTITDTRRMRTQLEKSNPRWAAFSKSHPLIFDRVVDYRTGPKELYALMHMIALRKQQDAGEITNGEETLQSFIMDTFAKKKD